MGDLVSHRSHPRRGLASTAWLVAGLLACVGWVGAVGVPSTEPSMAPTPVHEDVEPLLAAGAGFVVVSVAAPSRRRRRARGLTASGTTGTAGSIVRLVRTGWGQRSLARPGPAPVRGPPLLVG